MKTYRAKIIVRLKQGILDPQGKAITHALSALGFTAVADARVGKIIELGLQGLDEAGAHAEVERACEKLLANPVIEEYSYQLEQTSEGEA